MPQLPGGGGSKPKKPKGNPYMGTAPSPPQPYMKPTQASSGYFKAVNAGQRKVVQKGFMGVGPAKGKTYKTSYANKRPESSPGAYPQDEPFYRRSVGPTGQMKNWGAQSYETSYRRGASRVAASRTTTSYGNKVLERKPAAEAVYTAGGDMTKARSTDYGMSRGMPLGGYGPRPAQMKRQYAQGKKAGPARGKTYK